MFILKLSLLTCVFYLAISLAIEALVLAAVHWTGLVGFHFQRGWTGIVTIAVFWGVIWLLLFLLAFRISFPSLWARFVG